MEGSPDDVPENVPRGNGNQLAVSHSTRLEHTNSIEVASRTRRPWQWSIRTLLLAMLLIAIWGGYAGNRWRVEMLRREIDVMRPLSRELTVQRLDQAAFVQPLQLWYDECRWHYYLPEGRYRIFLATREIAEGEELARSVASAVIPAGRHVLSIDQVKEGEQWEARLECDAIPIITHKEPSDWYPENGSVGGARFETLTEVPVDAPIVLFKRRFWVPYEKKNWYAPPREPCNGLQVWIERE